MKTHTFSIMFANLFISGAVVCFVFAWNITKAQISEASSNPRPKLVIGIVVDQMRSDYIYRYWDKYGKGGFRRLVNEGFVCKNTHYNYMPTYTGPGHASIYTGTTPAVHGIIANDWYVRKIGKLVYCADDSTVHTVGGNLPSKPMSPRNMLTTTIGDELRLATNFKSKVIGIALKDRGAIFPAGHSANAAYWLDDDGSWITSSHYMNVLPAWLQEFNKKELVKTYLSQPWNTLLPIEQYTESAADDNKWEGTFPGEQKPVFPHVLPELMKKMGAPLIRATPFGNALTINFAIAAIKGESLGKRTQTDLLAISFSSTDYIGHQFGPQSIEIEDTYLRLDRELAEFLSFLDNEIGKNNYLLFLTADHGAIHVPSYLTDHKIPAGYFSGTDLLKMLNTELKSLFGIDSLIMDCSNSQIFINYQLIERRKLNVQEVKEKIILLVRIQKGVHDAISTDKRTSKSGSSPVFQMIQNGIHPQRSGDIIVVLEPGWAECPPTGTTHGSPYSYDTHVPLIFMGAGIKPGSSTEQVVITDIAPTISMLLNISLPNGCTGKPISFSEK